MIKYFKFDKKFIILKNSTKKENNKTILFVVNSDWFFLSHRLPIAKKSLEKGYNIHLACEISDKRKELERYGINLHDIKIKRSSTSLLSSFLLFLEFLKIFKKTKPDLIHLVTIKPVLIGGLAAKFLKKSTKIVMSVTGLGYIFIDKGIKAFLRKQIIIFFYKFVFKHNYLKVIFQNKTDLSKICKLTNLPINNTILIPGSGVDLTTYNITKIPLNNPIVLLPARLISSKGIYEFIESAKNLKNLARFVIVGKNDTEARNCIKIKELAEWQKAGIIEYWGESNDMPKIFQQSTIVVLPSYREGMPKSLLEAAACGRPIITTNVPGCRDSILDGITGILVPVGDPNSLTLSLKKLLKNPNLINSMGKAGRNLAEKRFDIEYVVKKHLEIYQLLLSI